MYNDVKVLLSKSAHGDSRGPRSRRSAPLLGLLALAGLLAAGCGGAPAMPVCLDSTTPQAVGAFCAPAAIAAGQALRLQLREQCGGCTQRATRCEAVVQGQEVKLRLLGQSCTLPPDYACAAICAISTFDCAVPPLAAGTYRVSAESGSAAAVMMTADPTISATSCTVQ
jgi:hypothetical protein